MEKTNTHIPAVDTFANELEAVEGVRNDSA